MPDGDVLTIVAGHQAFAAGGGGGSGALTDPGNVYPPTPTALTLGHRIKETLQGAVRVFEVTNAGTTEGSSMADFSYDLTPLGVTAESDVEWTYLGIVGQSSWEVAPQLPTVTVTQDGSHPIVTNVTNLGAPGDAERLFTLQATVAAVPVEVWDVKTDGDADWHLDLNSGAGFRFNVSEDGVASAGFATQMTTDGFKVYTQSETFEVNYDPFYVKVEGLPTSDPGAGHGGELWLDVAGGRVLKVSAG